MTALRYFVLFVCFVLLKNKGNLENKKRTWREAALGPKSILRVGFTLVLRADFQLMKTFTIEIENRGINRKGQEC